MPETPSSIGPFEIIRPVAQGGMAEVYEVRDPVDGRRLALKRLVELKTSVKRFNREFEALTRLNHPNIVRVYDYGVHDGYPWITMELLDGEPLQAWVKRFGSPGDPARTAEVVRVARLLADALQYVHDRGLVHRDLKSANIQVLKDGRVKLIDFGTAHLDDPLERITKDGDFVGTFSYAAPEQLLGHDLDGRADLYALGVLLYRLTTGRRPFKAADPHQVARMHLSVDPKPPRELVAALPEGLEALILHLLAKAPADRPARADDVARRLEDLDGRARHEVVHAKAIYADRSIGRSREHRQLWQVLEASEPGRVVLVVGSDKEDRGHFIRQLGQDAVKRRWRAVLCHAVEDPMASLVAALSALAEDASGELASLASATGGVARATLHASMATLVRDVARALAEDGVPAALVVEELPRFGSEAREHLPALLEAAREEGAPFVVVASAAGFADTDAYASLQRAADRVDVVALHALDLRETALAVGDLLHRRPPPPAAVRRLHEATGGRPTLLAQVVEDLLARGDLTLEGNDDHRVDWGAAVREDHLPEVVVEALAERIQGLPAVHRSILEVLAVAGGQASPSELAAGLGWDVPSLVLTLAGLRDAGWVRWGGTPYDLVRPTEPLVLRTLDDAVEPRRRVVIEGNLAQALRDVRRPAQVRILLSIGLYERALDGGLRVVEGLVSEGRLEEASDLLERLRAATDQPGSPRALRSSHHLWVAHVLQRIQPMDPRIGRSLQRAGSLAEGPEEEAQVHLARAEMQGAIGHYANHRRELLEAWGRLETRTPSPLMAQVALSLAESFEHGAQLSLAQSWYERAQDVGRALGHESLVAQADVGATGVALARGDLEGAEARFEALFDLHDALARRGVRDRTAGWLARAGWAESLRRQGRFSEAIGPARVALQEARAGQSTEAYARLVLVLAELELDLARLGQAQELIDELVASLGAGERLHLRLEARLVQARIRLASGLSVEADFTLQEVTEQAEKAGLASIAERARTCWAEARQAIGMTQDAELLYQQALLGLMPTGDQCALADAVVSRARSMGALDRPEKGFRLLLPLLRSGAFRTVEIERILAELRYAVAHDERGEVTERVRQAQAMVTRLAMKQDDLVQGAFRVHPWTRFVQRVAASRTA